MKISLNWLREYVAFDGDAEALAEILTMTGVEVEKIERRGSDIEHVVVAQILESTKHPKADRLSVCKVADGTGEPRQIVCGAKNYKVGDMVPLALPGAVLPGDFKIKVGRLRDVESQGMLCSAEELGLPKGEDGLLILPPGSEVGAPLGSIFPSDAILDLEITPNRSDLLSHIGVAREVAALTGLEFTAKRVRNAELNSAHPVEIAADECPFYSVRKITGVAVGPSPAWLRQKLETVGIRSINNIVDITNFVMLEMGQPLHAFDAYKVEGDLWVRPASAGEKFLALDGKTYELNSTHLVIADTARVAAIAGVMGGEGAGVTEKTTSVWIESAYFQPTSIRRTSRGLGLSSDSSYRFERDVDPAGVLIASQRATELIAEIAGGAPGELRIGFGAKSQFGFDAEGAAEGIEYTGSVPLRRERCARLLGVEISDDEISAILTGFGLRQSETGWEIPSFRPDLVREVDLIEEIARVIGIEQVPERRTARFAPASDADREYDRLMDLRRRLAGFGLHEARTLSLISERGLKYHLGPSAVQRLRNPLSEDHAVLRPSLLPGLMDALARNGRAGERAVRLFEIGRIFASEGVEESLSLALVLSGPVAPPSWRSGALRNVDLFDLKGLLAALFGANVHFADAQSGGVAYMASVAIEGGIAGRAGQLWPNETKLLDLSAPAVFAEIGLSAWLRCSDAGGQYREIPRFPPVTRDIAMIVAAGTMHSQIDTILSGANEPLLATFDLFDVFTDPSGEKMPAGKKSLAYSLTYRSPERTLTADEVNAAHARVKERLTSALQVQLRE